MILALLGGAQLGVLTEATDSSDVQHFVPFGFEKFDDRKPQSGGMAHPCAGIAESAWLLGEPTVR